MVFDPSSPLDAIRRRFPGARVDFADGRRPEEAARAARAADAVVVFADQYLTETADAPDLELPRGQDALIEKRGARQPAHRRRARNGRAGPHAVARPPGRGHRGLVSRAEGGRSDRRHPVGRRQPVRPADRSPSPRAWTSFPIRGHSGEPDSALRSARSGAAAATAESSPPITRKARRSATSGSSPAANVRFSRSAMACPTRRFALRDLKVSVNGVRVTASVIVRNLGSRAGAAVAQLYLSGPPGRQDSAAARGLEPNRACARRRARDDDLGRSAPPGDIRRNGAAMADRGRLISVHRRLRRRPARPDDQHLARFGGTAAVTGYHAAKARLTRLRNAVRRASVVESIP